MGSTRGRPGNQGNQPHPTRSRNDNRERTPPLVRLKAVCGPGDDGEPSISVLLADED